MNFLAQGNAGRPVTSLHLGMASRAATTWAAAAGGHRRLGSKVAGLQHRGVAAFSSAADDPMGSLLELRSTLGKKNVKYLLPSYVDMHGVSKSKVVPLSHMMNMMGATISSRWFFARISTEIWLPSSDSAAYDWIGPRRKRNVHRSRPGRRCASAIIPPATPSSSRCCTALTLGLCVASRHVGPRGVQHPGCFIMRGAAVAA